MRERIISLKEVNGKQELHNLLSNNLGSPDWYGNNWDAFWDLITDAELMRPPDKLTFAGFQEFSETLPRDAELLQQCFWDMKENYPSIVCEVNYSRQGRLCST
jgi:ribonuclease inhibitor